MQAAKLLLILFVLTTAFTCNKNDDALESKKMSKDDMLTFSYAQTQCADPWPTSFDDNITAQNVKRYLDSAGVEVKSVAIKRTSLEATCLACTCPSGKVIYVTTPNTQEVKARILQLNFD